MATRPRSLKDNLSATSNQFMKELLERTIPGAAFDSSARDPPARCHPGTRLAVLERCRYFIVSCNGEKKIRWVVGAVGVGKSAIMQNVAESPNLPVTFHASIFFSVNGRNDGTKAIVSLSYQLAAKTEPYRQLTEYEITRDPSLLQSSIRPEQHIISFFSKPNVMPTYEKEEIPVDSTEARADIERFLRDELNEVRQASDSLDPQWPEERDLWKLADASGGLFAYAHTIVRYIGDLNIGNPVSQFSDVLNIIDNHPTTDMPREEHPMALLDAMYARIMSNIPPKIMIYYWH